MLNFNDAYLNCMISKIDFYHARDVQGVFTVKSINYPVQAKARSLDNAVSKLQDNVKQYLKLNYLLHPKA